MREMSDATKLRQVRRELKDTQSTLISIRTELRQRRQWGQMMSNLCFNLAQNEKYDAAHRQSMKDCQKNWDKIKTIR